MEGGELRGIALHTWSSLLLRASKLMSVICVVVSFATRPLAGSLNNTM